MKTINATLITLGIVLLTTSGTFATDLTWDGGGGTDNWSTGDNWDPSDSDLTTDDTVRFFNTDMTTIGTVNSIVDGNYSIGALTLNPEDGTDPRDQGHTLRITADNSLTVTGSFRVGDSQSGANDYRTNVEFQGGGTLTVNGNVAVYNASNSYTNCDHAILDLSKLAKFNVNAGSAGAVTIGYGNEGRGDLILAQDNDITAGTIDVGRYCRMRQRNNYVRLGESNDINVNTFRIGADYHNGLVEFWDGLSEPGEVTLRGIGGDRVGTITIADSLGGKHSYTTSGTLDLSGGSADILVSNLYVGSCNYDGAFNYSTNGMNGSLILGDGVIDATHLRVGWIGGTGSVYPPKAVGTATLNGGKLIADTITLGDDDATNSDNVTGTMNLSGGTIEAQTIQKGSGNGTVAFNWDGGTIANKTDGDLTIGAGVPITLDTVADHTFDIDTGQTATVNGVIGEGAASVGIIKNGGGTLYLNADNTFTGAVTANAGTLGGSGSVDGDVDMASTTRLAPGASIDTFNVAQDLTLAGGTYYDWEASSADSLDLVTVDGTLFLEGTITVNLLNTTQTSQTTPPSPNGFLLFSAGSLDTSAFDGWNIVLNDYWYPIGTPEITMDGGNVYLNGAGFIPEPTTFGLLALGALAILRRRRPEANRL
ncbi:MAG: PEP-CTERM sorting domain-containing protein [Candidatus Pacebacteria bacterium]|nr:PEP-CTERM sorting domain-containing protein [Candidatus Paceibacterota bacterium]